MYPLPYGIDDPDKDDEVGLGLEGPYDNVRRKKKRITKQAGGDFTGHEVGGRQHLNIPIL